MADNWNLRGKTQMLDDLNTPSLQCRVYDRIAVQDSMGKSHFYCLELSAGNTFDFGFCRKENVSVVIRGVRVYSDFEYEFQMALTNRRMAPEIETLFMMPSENLAYVTASTVREIVSYGGDTAAFVTSAVQKRLLAAVKA